MVAFIMVCSHAVMVHPLTIVAKRDGLRVGKAHLAHLAGLAKRFDLSHLLSKRLISRPGADWRCYNGIERIRK